MSKAKLILWTGASPRHLRTEVGAIVGSSGVPHKVKKIESGLPKLRKGDVCLAMGTKAVTELAELGMVPKNRKVGSLRGHPIPCGKGQMFLTFDPKLPTIDIPRKTDIIWDTNLAVRYFRHGTTAPKLGKYTYVDSFKKAIEKIKKLYEKMGRVPVSIDLETLSLDPIGHDKWIITISLTYQEGKSEVIKFTSKSDPKQPAIRDYDEDGNFIPFLENEELWDEINWLATETKYVKVYGANFKFDMGWMLEHWGIQRWDTFAMDTTIVGSLLDENRSNSLETHAKIYTPLGGYDSHLNKTYDKGRMDLVPDEDLLPYAGGDTDAGLRVGNIFRTSLINDNRALTFYRRVMHPAVHAFNMIEHRGIVLDIEQFDVLKVKVQEEIDQMHKLVIGMFHPKTRAKFADNLSLGRAVILEEYLFTKRGLNLKPVMFTPKGKVSTAMDHFNLLAEKHESIKPFLEAMRNYNSATKTMSTYIVGFTKHLRDNGKFHPNYMLYKGSYGNENEGDSGAGTGRTSAKDPAYQTIPKHTKWAKPLRTVYVPPKDHCILNVDYSQGELKVAACLANETTMIDAYLKGMDLHSVTGSSVYGMTLDELFALQKKAKKSKKAAAKLARIRQGGKAGNFGLLYAMQAPGFRTYAKVSYGVELTAQESEDFRDAFFARFTGLLPWHERILKYARKHGEVVSPLGRTRHLPLINSSNYKAKAQSERQAINATVQSTLSDLGLMAMGQLNEDYPELWMFGFTHDAISAYVPIEEAQLWGDRIAHAMENIPLEEYFGWKPQLPFTTDIEMGLNNMAELDSIENVLASM